MDTAAAAPGLLCTLAHPEAPVLQPWEDKQSSAMINSGLLTNQAPCRDEDRGFQLYHSDPSGNYGGWKATAIGQNHQAAQNIMKQDYKEDMDLQAAMQLVIKVCAQAQACILPAEPHLETQFSLR